MNNVFRYTDNGVQCRLTVKAELSYLKGNSAPYFSLTADLDEQSKTGRWREIAGGCMHDEIAKHAPKYAPLIRLHLSDIYGVPMHAAGNANYMACGGCWLGSQWLPLEAGYKTRATDEQCRERLARHLRISDAVALGIWNEWAGYRGSPSGYKEGETRMARLVEVFKPRWLREAQEAIRAFDLRVVGNLTDAEKQEWLDRVLNATVEQETP